MSKGKGTTFFGILTAFFIGEHRKSTDTFLFHTKVVRLTNAMRRESNRIERDALLIEEIIKLEEFGKSTPTTLEKAKELRRRVSRPFD